MSFKYFTLKISNCCTDNSIISSSLTMFPVTRVDIDPFPYGSAVSSLSAFTTALEEYLPGLEFLKEARDSFVDTFKQIIHVFAIKLWQ